MRSFKKAVSIIMAASLTAGVLAVPYTDKAAAIEQTAAPTTSPVATEAASMLPATSPVSSPVATATAQPTVTPGVQQIAVPVRTIPPQLARRTAKPAATPKAKKAYGDKLKLNNEIKLNQTKTYVKKGRYGTYVWKAKNYKTGKVKYTISSKRKSVGNKYKVTYKVKYKFLADPKLVQKKMGSDEWYACISCPQTYYTVFDYQTGKSLERKNKLGVKVAKNSKWKNTYYPKRYFEPFGALAEWIQNQNPKNWRTLMARKNNWYRNIKSVSHSFTVTYPKDCKDVVVGIGFANMFNYQPDEEKGYWKGQYPFGQCAYYKYGKKTTSFMRLDQ